MRASAGNDSARILMLLENNPYPQDARVRREARSLTKAGYHVSVICPAGGGQQRHETVEGVDVYRYPAPPEGTGVASYLLEYGYSLAAAIVLTARVAATTGFDVVHAHNPPDTTALLGALLKLFGKRYVFDHHDLSPEMYFARFDRPEGSSRLLHRALLAFEKLSFRVADHVISTNESYRQIAIERGGVPEDRVTVVRNGPDLDRVRRVEPSAELRSRASTIIGYVGEMGVHDGLDVLLRSLEHLRYELHRDDFLAVLVGSGDALADLRSQCERLGLDDHVVFTGRVPDDELLLYLSTADICVDPDPSNSFNDRSTMIKLGEYLALGKPVVAFDLPEHRVTAGDAAVYVPGNDEHEFARTLAGLMDDPESRRRMGLIGLERAEKLLCWPRQEPNLLEAYEALLGSGTRKSLTG